MSDTPEKTSLRIGVVPLVDAAPIVVAQALGLFSRRGLQVEISLERSWATVRDKVAAGVLDASQMLAPMPIAATLGLDAIQVPMLTALTLNLNGNAIVVSNTLHARLQTLRQPEDAGALGWARTLKRLIEADHCTGRPLPVFAHVYPFSTHHYELRYWLAAADIHPDHDLNLIVVPPPLMVTQLETGRIDGFCVGAPWGEFAEQLGIGHRIVSKYQIWNNSPEKVLGVTRRWAETYPNTHLELVAALIEANRWLDHAENRPEAARLLIENRYIDAPTECVMAALCINAPNQGFGPGLVFHNGAAGFPWISQACWFIEQMNRWKTHGDTIDADKQAAQIYRPDLYRAAAERIGEPVPNADFKIEGLHRQPWTIPTATGVINMGTDHFLDSEIYDYEPK